MESIIFICINNSDLSLLVYVLLGVSHMIVGDPLQDILMITLQGGVIHGMFIFTLPFSLKNI